METSFRLSDADNHYYETEDAFTRYLDPKMASRGVQWAQVGNRRRLIVGGSVSTALANPTFDPIARPGSLMDYFRGTNTAGTDVKTMYGQLDPLAAHPEYIERDARIKVMDQQQLESTLLFPTLGVLVHLNLQHDVDALHATYHGFNQWLDEEWGFARDERIFTPPVIILSDVEQAVREVDWALDRGARILCMIPGPVCDRHGGYRSPASPEFDPVWARIEEAGVPVGFHGTDRILDSYLSLWEKPNDAFAIFNSTFKTVITHGRTIFDTMAALLCHGLFDRFPGLRVATIETGSNWVGHLLEELGGTYGKRPQDFREDPRETFKRHIWVSPFFEDNFSNLKAMIGADRMLFGSDWPHAEGLVQPADYLDEIRDFDDVEKVAVLGANLRELLGIS